MDASNAVIIDEQETLNSINVTRDLVVKSFSPVLEAQMSLQRMFGVYRSNLEWIAKSLESMGFRNDQSVAPKSDNRKQINFSSLNLSPKIEPPVVEVTPHPFWKRFKLTDDNPVVVNLPSTAIWDDVKIQLENGFDILVYYRGEFVGKYSHDVLGFVRTNTNEKLPDRSWGLLQQLAIISKYPKQFPTIELLADALEVEKNNCQKIKQTLAKKLCAAFGISDNPFLDYLPTKGYRTKFKLQPEPIFRSNLDPRKYGVEYSENNGEDDLRSEDQ